jgi:hypothetical protein
VGKSLAVRVGHDPAPRPDVRGAEVGSGQNIPLRIIPDVGKGPENVAKSCASESSHVLDDDDSGLTFSDESVVLEPESGLFAMDSCLSASDGDVLAGEAADERIDLGQSRRVQGANIREPRNLGPVIREHLRAPGIDLDLERAGPPRALSAQVPKPDAREQRPEDHSSPKMRIKTTDERAMMPQHQRTQASIYPPTWLRNQRPNASMKKVSPQLTMSKRI